MSNTASQGGMTFVTESSEVNEHGAKGSDYPVVLYTDPRTCNSSYVDESVHLQPQDAACGNHWAATIGSTNELLTGCQQVRTRLDCLNHLCPSVHLPSLADHR